ncbi:hypothetical protein JZ751_027177 [Albula glossodonta]|uniref:Protein held out wings n=1 Tax=Albula glossodonta TaxID=121402 RepID=A0A8T2MXF7_9TELE|nr:hypothetical protein JZ751_027177 [Albula glossodonta]
MVEQPQVPECSGFDCEVGVGGRAKPAHEGEEEEGKNVNVQGERVSLRYRQPCHTHPRTPSSIYTTGCELQGGAGGFDMPGSVGGLGGGGGVWLGRHAKEEQNRGKPNWEHLNEDLHVLITVEDTQARAEIKMRRAVEEVKKLLVPAQRRAVYSDVNSKWHNSAYLCSLGTSCVAGGDLRRVVGHAVEHQVFPRLRLMEMGLLVFHLFSGRPDLKRCSSSHTDMMHEGFDRTRGKLWDF